MPLIRRDVAINASDGQTLDGTFSLPANPKGVVIFAHGSGSNKDSPRNNYVSQLLNDSGIATVLVNLLSKSEFVEDDATRKFRFDIPLLTARLVSVTQAVADWPEICALPVGYFGASTGAAAAFNSAGSVLSGNIRAIVSRGGRVDLAKSLKNVKAATLLLVGGNDAPVIALNQKALGELKNVRAEDKRLLIVPGAGHAFDEEGTMDEVARHACSWFERYLLR